MVLATMTRRLKTSCPNSPTARGWAPQSWAPQCIQWPVPRTTLYARWPAKGGQRLGRLGTHLQKRGDTPGPRTHPPRTRDARSRRAGFRPPRPSAPMCPRVLPCLPSRKLSRSRHLVPRHHPVLYLGRVRVRTAGDMSGVESGGSADTRERVSGQAEGTAGMRQTTSPVHGCTAGQLAARRVSGRR